MKKKIIILLAIFCLTIGIVNPCLATNYYDNTWSLSPTAYTINWGLKGFPYDLRAHEAANAQGSTLNMFYHECNGFWYPRYYAAQELWYTVEVMAKYKSGSTTVGTVNSWDWSEMSWYLKPGQTESGGYNSTDYNLSTSQTCKGEYTGTVDCDDLYWPLVDTRSLTF